MILDAIFWIACSLLAYTFVGYPLVIKLLASIIGKESKPDEAYHPSVNVILSVYNEEEVIEAKIANFLALDYPASLLDLVVISDCCSDRTDELIRKHANQRIHLLIQSERSGKTRNLNRGTAAASGDILVFTDANAMFDRDVIKKLVRHFADPEVGLVSGKSMYLDATGGVTSGGAYRKYEDFIKESESRVGGIIGADGAIYALRKTYYTPLPPEYINDFIHPIQVILGSGRAVNDDHAICREEIAEAEGSELNRQTRIMAQSWRIFFSQFGILLNAGKAVYLWQFISHKFLRWLTLPLMILLFVTNAALVSSGNFLLLFFVAQIVFILCAVVGSRRKGGLMQVAYLFFLLHYAAVIGLLKYLKGDIYSTWEPRND